MYNFKYKRYGRFFYKTLKDVVGHNYLPDQNKMVVYFKSGRVVEIPHWNSCGVDLGTDWVNYVREKAERESGVPLRIDPR